MRRIATGVVGAMIAALCVVHATPAGAQLPTCFGRVATIVAEPGQVTNGTSGPDVIVGTSGVDLINGRGGNDRICSRGGDDVVLGGDGNDRIDLGRGDDTANGGKGNDTIKGRGGQDTIVGKRGRDRLFGGSGSDDINGNGGADRIRGGGGSDTLEGGRGDDDIGGGRGIDVCRGGSGDDTVSSCNEQGTLSPGTHLVGTDLAPGRYVADAGQNCYWERLRGLSGEVADIIANDFQGYGGQAIVDVDRSDLAFGFDADCGSFSPWVAPRSAAADIVAGTHVVGADIRPGTYRADDAREGCYWERLSSFSGRFSAILANDLSSSDGRVLVTIDASDEGFATNDHCGTWERV